MHFSNFVKSNGNYNTYKKPTHIKIFCFLLRVIRLLEDSIPDLFPSFSCINEQQVSEYSYNSMSVLLLKIIWQRMTSFFNTKAA